ncbi:methyltransferase domain-containing protein [Nitratifractor sp.]|uniref:methyltransferase domain-containing protein n=1 Tax=Nitratifractor sp. TaxID=2268144 RepID=UPI0025E66D3B|nr:methyltransferase domain-containing protein [Nitratifractor sp.]
MRAVKEFSRFAESYGRYNIIQRQVARRLVCDFMPRDPGRLLDLGCGEGEIFRQLCGRQIPFGRLFAVDLSQKMLKLHPRDKRVQLLQGDFDDPGFLESLEREKIDTVLSASALQWSRDLGQTAEALSNIGNRAAFAIFTSGTFRTLHHCAGTGSPIRSYETVEAILQQYYEIDRIEKMEYRLGFEDPRAIFRYIKRSGVSGGEPRLTYRQIRRLIDSYPLDYLEFELLFFSGRPKRSFSKA